MLLAIIAIGFIVALVAIVVSSDFEDKRTFEEWSDDQW